MGDGNIGKEHKKKKIKQQEAPPLMDQLQVAIDKRDWDKAENPLKKKLEQEPTDINHYLLGFV